MAITLRVNEDENALLRAYADLHNEKISTLIKNIIFEKIYNDYDLKSFDESFEETKDGKWFSQEDVEKELGL